MQRVHLIYGVILLVLFLFSGYFMLKSFPEIYGTSPEIRMMFRANHIYILFAALINLLLAISTVNTAGRFRETAERFSSIFILTGGILLVTAFFIEPASSAWNRPLTFSGILLHLTGIIVIVVLRLSVHRKKDIKIEK